MAESHVFLPYLACCKHRHKRRRRGSLLYIGPPVSFFAFHQAHHSRTLEAKFSRRFNRLNGRSPSSANIIDNHHSGSLAAEAFDSLPRAMLLFSLAHQETVQRSAGHRDRNYDRIGAHSQSANRLRVPTALSNLFEKNLPCKLRPTRIKRRGSAINVVVAPPSG